MTRGSDGSSIDVGVIVGSGLYSFPGEVREERVETAFGEAVMAVGRVGRWRVGAISRHGPGHRFLPHQIGYRSNLVALSQLGVRALLATTVVGAVDPALPLGEPVLFDELFFPENRLPNGEICTIFTEPGDPERGHLILDEPFSPRLRRRVGQAAKNLALEPTVGGVYGHTNGPRFETRPEIRSFRAAGVTAVSLTCGPEAVLAGELELPYALVGFPVNYAAGVGEPGTKEDLDRLLARSKEALPQLLLRTIESLEDEDFVFDYGYVYRLEGGI
ncbi:MAG: MTAP family purine nucleoside phosphorylase [Actinomycetota bacterium]|nr:MTAP family purine nucleoside phosphorylase [Actinomycetota bacterium]